MEALNELQGAEADLGGSLQAALWIPIGKVENPTHLDQVRDLELPNEDRKILSRMIALLLDEAGARSMHLREGFLPSSHSRRVPPMSRTCPLHRRLHSTYHDAGLLARAVAIGERH